MSRAKITAVLFACNIVTEVTFVVGFVAGRTFVDLFGITDGQLGFFFGGGEVGWIVCSVLAGHATHRWGTRPVLLAGLGTALAGILVLMSANGYGMLLAGSVLIGMTFPFASNANATLLAELYPEKLRRMSSLAAAVWFAGTAACAPVIGSFLVTAKEHGWGRWGFAVPYGVCLVAVLGCLGAVRTVLGKQGQWGGREEREAGESEELGLRATGSGWIWIVGLSVLHGIMLMTITNWATKMGQEKFGLAEAKASILYSVVAFGLGGGRLILARANLRLDERGILSVSAAAGSLLCLAGLAAPDFLLTMIGMGAGAFLFCATFPCLTAIVGTRYKREKAKLYGLMTMGIAVGGVIGPATAGMLSERGIGLDRALALGPVAGLGLALASLAWLLTEKRKGVAPASVKATGCCTSGEGKEEKARV